ncbi:MAG: fibronectin type III domain-containing protein, partial [Muribaculaceae bacterium]|nr:fibronectin type III domain-containing protein [Muribaculaceae bacterium]
DITGVDGDSENSEGYAFCSHTYVGANSHDRLSTPKIDLRETAYPVMSFYYAAIKGIDNRLSVEYVLPESEAVVLADFGANENAPDDAEFAWIKKTIVLEGAKGSNATITFHAYTPEEGSFGKIYIDKVVIDDYPPVGQISANLEDETAVLTWEAPSNGRLTADSYDVAVNDAEPVRVAEPAYSFATEPDQEYSVTVRANYADIPSAESEPATIKGVSAIQNIGVDQPVATEYFDISGRRIISPAPGTFVIKRTTMPDGSVITEKANLR